MHCVHWNSTWKQMLRWKIIAELLIWFVDSFTFSRLSAGHSSTDWTHRLSTGCLVMHFKTRVKEEEIKRRMKVTRRTQSSLSEAASVSG